MTLALTSAEVRVEGGLLLLGDVTPPAYSGPTDFPGAASPSLPTTWTGYTVGDPVITRWSESYAAPTYDSEGRPQDGWQPTVTEEDWGTFRVSMNGVDVTAFRGVKTVIDYYELQDPFGCGPARITFHSIRGTDNYISGALSAWLQQGVDVDIIRLHPDGTTTDVLWSGQSISYETEQSGDEATFSVVCVGDLWSADYQKAALHQAPYLPAQDLGTLLANTMNAVIGRKFNRAATVSAPTTGISVRRRAAATQGFVEYLQELLASYGLLADGTDAWTIGRVPGSPRTYSIRLRHSYSTQNTVRMGGRWSYRLVKDGSAHPNVYYGSGTNDAGGYWANWLYPSSAGNIIAASRYPLTIDGLVQPRLYNSTTGVDLGANPGYSAAAVRIEADLQFGSGVSKADGKASAVALRAQAPQAQWVGTWTLEVDPAERSKFDVREGDYLTVQGMDGQTSVDLHIAKVRVVPPQESSGGSVELTVDQGKRDLATVAAIIANDAEAKNDPARLPARLDRLSRLRRDSQVPFDSESEAGWIRNLSVPNQTWTRIDVPVSATGDVAAIDLQTTPARAFSIAFFGDLSVVAADLVTNVGNPFATSTDGFSAYDRHANALDALGFIQAIGMVGQAAGYSRLGSAGEGYQTPPPSYGSSSTALTGRLYNTASWHYASTKPPFLRVFFWVTGGACTISGRIVAAPIAL